MVATSMAEYQTALRLKSDFAEAHYNLGLAYSSQSQMDRVISEFQAALRLKPDYAKAYSALGLAYGSQGQLDGAVAEFLAALRLNPNDYAARQRLNDIVSRRH